MINESFNVSRISHAVRDSAEIKHEFGRQQIYKGHIINCKKSSQIYSEMVLKKKLT